MDNKICCECQCGTCSQYLFCNKCKFCKEKQEKITGCDSWEDMGNVDEVGN